MTQSKSKSRMDGSAATFVDQRLTSGRVAFPLADLVKETGLSVTAARKQLLRLGNRVTRVSPRQQFFLIVSPEHRAVGAPPVAWWLQDYFEWLGQPYYLALQSAASSFGSNPQALQVTQVMTKTPRRTVETGRIRIQFFVKHTMEQTPTQPLANAYAPMQVSTPEATSYDLIRYAARIGGIGRAAETIGPLLPLIRTAELRRVLEIEDGPATAQRLGFVLEKLRATKLAQVVQDWLPSGLIFVPLVPGLRGDAPEIKRWKIINNALEFGR
ncbi:MAG TPA: type IV toxin-antitoxin system AbiEi family antitoxin [Verrucomicrobiae bacterium]|nr:type IV toxin-antitoxin system AbiEi family antitoxin [Verrucomicrobiae bacterium]